MQRRQFILCSGAALAATGLGAPLSVAARSLAGQTFDLESLDRQAVERARELALGRSVRLTILIPGGSGSNVEPLAAAFSEATGIDLSLVEAPVNGINARVILDAMSGGGDFDLALPATFGLPDLAEAGALLDLDDFARRYEPAGFSRDALFSLGDRYKGRLYGYQTDGDAYLMFYNQDLLNSPAERDRFEAAHGYELRMPRTWRELDQMMAFFHRPEQGRYGGALFRTPDYMAWEFWIRFHAKGRWPFDEDLTPLIDGAAGVEALEELVAASRHLYPGATSDGLFENWKAFAEGNIFCDIGWGGTQKYMNRPDSAMRGRLAFGPTPGGMVDGKLLEVPYFNWGWNYTVSTYSAEPEIAYLFALFACSPRMSTVGVREPDGFFDPFRREHYDDPQIVETYSDSFLAAHRESMERSIPDLYLKGQGEYFDALRENLVLANKGQVTAAVALGRTAKQWRQTTRRLGRDSQIEQWAFLRSRYPQAVRERLAF